MRCTVGSWKCQVFCLLCNYCYAYVMQDMLLDTGLLHAPLLYKRTGFSPCIYH